VVVIRRPGSRGHDPFDERAGRASATHTRDAAPGSEGIEYRVGFLRAHTRV
jgi:hypothetical protein